MKLTLFLSQIMTDQFLESRRKREVVWKKERNDFPCEEREKIWRYLAMHKRVLLQRTKKIYFRPIVADHFSHDTFIKIEARISHISAGLYSTQKREGVEWRHLFSFISSHKIIDFRNAKLTLGKNWKCKERQVRFDLFIRQLKTVFIKKRRYPWKY